MMFSGGVPKNIAKNTTVVSKNILIILYIYIIISITYFLGGVQYGKEYKKTRSSSTADVNHVR